MANGFREPQLPHEARPFNPRSIQSFGPIMTSPSAVNYFETDQVKHAVALWKLVRRAGEPEIDVLKFGRDWQYADAVLLQCLASEHENVSDAALALMQMRLAFEQEQPERARKLGAGAAGTVNAAASKPRPASPSGSPQAAPNEPGQAAPAPAKYLKSLR